MDCLTSSLTRSAILYCKHSAILFYVVFVISIQTCRGTTAVLTVVHSSPSFCQRVIPDGSQNGLSWGAPSQLFKWHDSSDSAAKLCCPVRLGGCVESVQGGKKEAGNKQKDKLRQTLKQKKGPGNKLLFTDHKTPSANPVLRH